MCSITRCSAGTLAGSNRKPKLFIASIMLGMGGIWMIGLSPGPAVGASPERGDTVVVQTSDGFVSYPSGTPAWPTDWDFYGDAWQARIVPAHAPILLFDAATDAAAITAQALGANRSIQSQVVIG